MRVNAGPRLNDGSPWTPKRFSAQWHEVLTGRVQKVRFHDLPHTHATLLMRQGIHPKVVSERVGHSTIDITLDTYSHVMPDIPDEAAEKLAGVLKAAMGAASRNQSRTEMAPHETIPFRPLARSASGSTGGAKAEMARRRRRGGVVLRGKIRDPCLPPQRASLRTAVRERKVRESLSSPFALPRAAAARAPAGRARRETGGLNRPCLPSPPATEPADGRAR